MLQIDFYTIYICVLCAYMHVCFVHICTCVHEHMEARCMFGCHHSPSFLLRQRLLNLELTN